MGSLGVVEGLQWAGSQRAEITGPLSRYNDLFASDFNQLVSSGRCGRTSVIQAIAPSIKPISSLVMSFSKSIRVSMRLSTVPMRVIRLVLNVELNSGAGRICNGVSVCTSDTPSTTMPTTRPATLSTNTIPTAHTPHPPIRTTGARPR
jgi:hypothetical protein